MDPTLSIIVPVYDVESFISQCVDSILNQTYADFELILINDGSPDKCGVICDDYALKDVRIKAIHKENGGLSSARNAGIEIATGRYLSFIDSDDFISTDYYKENMEYLLANPQTDLLVSQYCRYDNFRNEVIFNRNREVKIHDEIVNYMLSSEYLGTAWINIYRKDIFYHLRFPEGKIFEDGYILPEIVEKANNIYISNVGIYYYRSRENSIVNRRKSIKHWHEILETHIKQLDYCYRLSDKKRLFLGKYKVCHLALIYASIEYPSSNLKGYINKFQSYDYNLLQLLRSDFSFEEGLKLFVLKRIGFKSMIKIYKLLGLHKNAYLKLKYSQIHI